MSLRDPAPVRSPRAALLVAALGTVLSLIAFTMTLATIGPTGSDLGAGVSGRTWILSSMSIGLGAALLTAGTIADDVGRRRAFVVGLAVLVAGSLACVVTSSVVVFVAARIVQGVGSAAVIASSLGIIAHAFPAGPARARASGVWGASVGTGIAIGPVLAASLDQVVSWRAAYAVLAVASVAVGVLALALVDESRMLEPRGLDLGGAALLALAVSSFLAALVEGRSGWDRPVVVGLALASAALLAGFAVVEHRSTSPMIELSLLTHPPFLAATVAAGVTGGGIIALMSYLLGFLEAALGITPLEAALLLLAWSVTSVVTALLARRIPPRFPGRVQLAIGLLVVACGQLTLTGVRADSTWLHFLPGLLVAGVASGVVNAALGREAVASVPPGRGGMGSGANNTARYVGSAVGVTVVAVVAARPGPGSPVDDLISGWNVAVVVTAAVSLVGAAVVLACRPRRA
ncbi:transporter, major facilitator family protein [Aeromicrobium marinum DSM 15272]|uniref:Transporter, major facilitator family protein n=1 Tax=Aeromicrobium marinum DSM 15272 TaxID=585531 RepID=E2SCA1_9ACTN|nr:MFS transporter [Aeromicrobium marinum]EFQ83387.1 transporter, major facilitator family protein [Aeromicrobium marinum DSM 15272]